MRSGIRRSRKNKIIYSLLLVLTIVLFWGIENYFWPSGSDLDSGREVHLPEYIYPETSRKDLVLHAYYAFKYSEDHEQAHWVVYPLTRSHLTNDDRKRPFFVEDPKVKTFSADWRNYKNSGYDRGHLCPAGDRRFSESAYNETFYTSNISPMNPDFNAGVWNRLEIQVRNWAREYDSLYVITGGLLEDGLRRIGYEGVTVPDAFFKVVVRGGVEDLEAIAFLIPNRESSEPLEAFRVSVNDLEEETGINFFDSLDDPFEERLESDKNQSYWPF